MILAAQWLERAEEARSLAETLTLPEPRREMLKLEQSYRRMAKNALRLTARSQE